MSLESAMEDIVLCRDFRAAEVTSRMVDLHNKGQAWEERKEEMRVQRELILS